MQGSVPVLLGGCSSFPKGCSNDSNQKRDRVHLCLSFMKMSCSHVLADDSQMDELLQGVDPRTLEPSAQEMRAFKRKMGIRDSLSSGILGGAQSSVADAAGLRGSVRSSQQWDSTQQQSRPGSALLSRPGSASLNRPGSASLSGRPGSSSGHLVLGAKGGPVKDVMMHQRPRSARTGGGTRLLTPQQYTHAVGECCCDDVILLFPARCFVCA